MAHTKATGSTQNTRDSKPKYLGIKLYSGQLAKTGSIIVRQRGTRFLPGKNTDIGKDHTIYATKDGAVSFSERRRRRFDGNTTKVKIVSVT